MVLLVVLSVALTVWAAGIAVAWFLMDRPEGKRRCWWHRTGIWLVPRCLRPASASPCWMLA